MLGNRQGKSVINIKGGRDLKGTPQVTKGQRKRDSDRSANSPGVDAPDGGKLGVTGVATPDGSFGRKRSR